MIMAKKKQPYIPQHLNLQRARNVILNQISKEWGHFGFFGKNLWEEMSQDVGYTLEKPNIWKYTISSSLLLYVLGFVSYPLLISFLIAIL